LPHDFNFVEAFVYGVTTAETLVAIIGIASAAAFACLFATKFGEIILPKPKETRVADFLPFDRLMPDGATIRLKNGTLCRAFAVKGADTAFVMPETRAAMLEARKAWIDTMSEMEVTCRVVAIREKVPLLERGDHQNELLRQIAFIWADNLDRVYRNKYYIVLSIIDRKNNERDLNQAAQALMASLDEYDVQSLYETETNSAEEGPFHLFARICSPVSLPMPKVGKAEGEDLNDLLTADHIHFTGDKGKIRFFSGTREKFGIVMGIRASADYMDEQMTADLLSIDCEISILHTVNPISRIKAIAMLMHQKKMAALTNFSGSVWEQYETALETIEEADEDFQTLSMFSMSVFVYGEDDEEIEFGESEVERICRLYGVTPVREGWAAQASFFAQFPSYEIYPRTYRYLSRVVACSICLEKAAEGLPKCDWGDGPITIFKTTSGTAYQWQFHVTKEDNSVAHCCILGPTGQGKTTLLAFLAGQAMRHKDLRVYFFDRHRGVEIFTRAVNGAYINFDGDEGATTLNPFACSDTSENRAFLRRWLKAITMVDDAQSEKEIGRAVTTAFEYLKPNERTLKNLHKACFAPTGAMRRELYRWVNPDQYGNIFNAEDDNLDLTSRFMAFDFTHIFEDETLAPAVISYIMHRIQATTGETGDPSLIMIDETAPMLKHPMFRDNFIVGLQEGRKKRQAYLCAFQQPNIVDSLGLGEVIRGQCQTVIFFRNPQAMEEDYANWKLTPREMDFIFGRSFKEFPYAILLAKPSIGESVILDVNLGGLGPYLKLYSSGRKHVLLAEELANEYGESAFVEKFLELA
jgi:type IV secretion system protein VirB4